MSAPAVLRTLLRTSRVGGEDAHLLSAVAAGDGAAFAELVARYGPMTLGVCRRTLGPTADADDAFQITFLALAKHAGSVHTPAALPGWLHRTAVRAARKFQARRRVPTDAPEPIITPDPLAELSWKEVRAVLDEELNALPDHLRGPLVLCYLDGRTRDDAAAALGVSLSTLKRRIADGLDRLNRRLTRRGVAGVGLAAATLSGHGLTTQVPTTLANRVAATFAAMPTEAIGFASLVTGWRTAVSTVVLFGGLAAAGLALTAPADQGKAPPVTPVATADQPKVDAFGDPLPDGAVLRLGTVGFRAHRLHAIGFRNSKELVGISDTLSLHTWPVDGSPNATVTQLVDKQQSYGRPVLSVDGRFAAAELGASVVVWDISGAKPVEVATREFKDPFTIALSPNGEWLVVNEAESNEKEPLQLCHLPTKEWFKFAMKDRYVYSVSFTPNGQWLAATTDRDVRVIDVAEKKEIRQLGIPRVRPAHAALSPDGKMLAVLPSTWLIGAPPKVRLISVESGEEMSQFEIPSGFSSRVGFAPDGKTIWTGGANGLCEWDWKAGKSLHEIPGPANHPAVFSVDGNWLATHSESAVLLYDRKHGKRVRPDLIDGGHTSAIMGVTVSPDGKVIATDALDGEIRLWNAATAESLGRVQSTWGNDPRVVFLDSKTFVAVAEDYRTPVVYDATTGKELRRFTVPADWGRQHTTKDLRLSPDGKALTTTDSSATSAAPKSFSIRWDVETGLPLERLELKSDPRLDEIRGGSSFLSPDGKWEVRAGTVRRAGTQDSVQVVPGGELYLVPPVFSQDSGRVAFIRIPRGAAGIQHRQGGVVVYDLVRKTTLVDLPTGRSNRHALSPDGRQLAVLARTPDQEEVAVWDVASGKKVWSRPADYYNTIRARAIAFTPDGRRLISGHDCTALVWDVTGRDRSKTSTTSVADLWDALAGADAAASFAVGWELVDRPAEAVAVIREQLKPAKAADGEVVRSLVQKLGDRDFAEREAATKALTALGDSAVPTLRAAQKGELSLEQRDRIDRILAAVGKPALLTGEPLRAVRAVAVLERIGTARTARTLLEQLAGGQPDARLTQEAKAAVARLKAAGR